MSAEPPPVPPPFGDPTAADLLIVDSDVLKDIPLHEDRKRFIAVMQGGEIKAGQLT